MLKTIEAIIDSQGKVHWQEQPPIHGNCHVLITILDEPMLPKSDQQIIQESLLQFLLDSPEMSDTEYQAIQEKRQHLNQWL